MPYPEADLMTMRMRVCLPDESDVEYVYFNVYPYDGVTQWQATMLWEPTGEGGVWVSGNAGYVEVPGTIWKVVDGSWVTMEFTMNLKDMMYMGAMHNGVRGDMSAVPMKELSANTKRYMKISIKVVAVSAALTTMYCDFIYAGEYVEL